MSDRLERKIVSVCYFKCPECESLSEILFPGQDELFYCRMCGKGFPFDDFEKIERDELAYICPRCGEEVSITKGSQSGEVWGGPEPIIRCYKCNTRLDGYIHHEDTNGPEIKAAMEKHGGYQRVYHMDCEKGEHSYMTLERMTVDVIPDQEHSRVVLVFECTKCGDQQVIKYSLQDKRIWDAKNRVWWENPKFIEDAG